MPKSDFNKSCFATLLKLHFGMGFLLKICCMFSEHLFLGAASVYSLAFYFQSSKLNLMKLICYNF